MHMNTVAVYKLLPMLDTPGYEGFGTPGGSGISATEFIPKGVSTRAWQAPRLASVWGRRKVLCDKPEYLHDYPCIGFLIPALSLRAVDVLRDLLEPNGELLPLICDAGQYFAYNVTAVVDALDRDTSEIKWRAIDVLRKRELIVAEKIDHYEFRPEAVRALSIFRIPESMTGYYVTNVFADRIHDHGLRGFDLRKVWPLPRPKTGSTAEMERRAGLR